MPRAFSVYPCKYISLSLSSPLSYPCDSLPVRCYLHLEIRFQQSSLSLSFSFHEFPLSPFLCYVWCRFTIAFFTHEMPFTHLPLCRSLSHLAQSNSPLDSFVFMWLSFLSSFLTLSSPLLSPRLNYLLILMTHSQRWDEIPRLCVYSLRGECCVIFKHSHTHTHSYPPHEMRGEIGRNWEE